MKFNWTIKELTESSDDEILYGLVVERRSELNPYAPLSKRLGEISEALQERIKKSKAASPDLYDALKRTLDALFNETSGKPDTPWIRETKERARAAIQRAERGY